MDDTEILRHIEKLVNEEHELMSKSEGVGLDDDEQARMKSVEVSLDQCWDLLRQRRARRGAEFAVDRLRATRRSSSAWQSNRLVSGRSWVRIPPPAHLLESPPCVSSSSRKCSVRPRSRSIGSLRTPQSHCALQRTTLYVQTNYPLYVKTRPHKLLVPHIPDLRHSSCTI